MFEVVADLVDVGTSTEKLIVDVLGDLGPFEIKYFRVGRFFPMIPCLQNPLNQRTVIPTSYRILKNKITHQKIKTYQKIPLVPSLLVRGLRLKCLRDKVLFIRLLKTSLILYLGPLLPIIVVELGYHLTLEKLYFLLFYKTPFEFLTGSSRFVVHWWSKWAMW